MASKDSQRDMWANGGKGKISQKNLPTNVRNVKGIGPNKASGHKGGISRQGSKR